MNIGLIDADNWGKLEGCFPNLVCMKLSAYHKSKGDNVEWYNPDKHYDKVYESKVFTFTHEPFEIINADVVERGGTGYSIKLEDGKERFHAECHKNLADEIEHMYPDYGLYGITDTAYGFMSRGCPRGCGFCHVAPKEGRKAYKVADLSEFWNGQKYIKLFDPNTLACRDWRDLLSQLADSGACVDFTQGVDIRLMTQEKADALKRVKVKQVHFAFDRYQDWDEVTRNLTIFKEATGWKKDKVSVYILTNFDTTFEQDMARVMFVRSLRFQPYVMRYDKEHIARGSKINALARWANMPQLFWKYDTFEQYLALNREYEKAHRVTKKKLEPYTQLRLAI